MHFVPHRHGQPSNHIVPSQDKNLFGTVSSSSHLFSIFLESKDNFASKAALNLRVVQNVFAFPDDRSDYKTPIAIFGP